MAKVKVQEFPFGSLSVTRLLEEMRQELVIPDMDDLIAEHKKTVQALREAGAVTRQGLKDMREADVEKLHDAGDDLIGALRKAARALGQGDKKVARSHRRQAEAAFDQGLSVLKELTQHANGTSEAALSVLLERARTGVKDLKALQARQKAKQAGADADDA